MPGPVLGARATEMNTMWFLLSELDWRWAGGAQKQANPGWPSLQMGCVCARRRVCLVHPVFSSTRIHC